MKLGAAYEVYMITEYCPNCRVTRSMKVDCTTRTEVATDDKATNIETTTLHCGTCAVFVKSEENVLAEPGPAFPR